MSSTTKFIFRYTKARLFIFIRNKILKKQKKNNNNNNRHHPKKKAKRGGEQNVCSEGFQDLDRIIHGISFLIFAHNQVQYVHVHIYYSI